MLGTLTSNLFHKKRSHSHISLPLMIGRAARTWRPLIVMFLLISGVGAVLGSGGSVAKANPPTSTIEQHWELLAGTRLGLAGSTMIDINRGPIGGSELFDPTPTATFVIVAKVGAGIGGWDLWLKDAAGAAIADLYFSSATSGYQIFTAPVTWPTSTRELAYIHALKNSGTTRILDIKRAYLQLQQTGTIKATTGRIPLAPTQLVAGAAWHDVLDPFLYEHDSSIFDPAPAISLHVGYKGVGWGETARIRLIDNMGTVAVEASLDDGGFPYEQWSASLINGRTYRLQVYASLQWELLCADLIFKQSTSAPNGITKAVTWHPSVTSGVDLLSNEPLDFRLSTPTLNTEFVSGSWMTTIKRTSSTGTVRADFIDHAGMLIAAGVATSSSSFVALNTPVTNLPSSTWWDTRPKLASSGQGRLAGSVLRLVAGLRNTITNLAVSEPAFSPNDDGAKDTTTFTAVISPIIVSPNWTITINNTSTQTVRTLTGTGNNVSATWNGLNNAGSSLSDGTYTATLTVAGSSASAELQVILDTLAPAMANLTMIIAGETCAANYCWFSPNGDGVKDTVTMEATFETSTLYTLTFDNGFWGLVKTVSGTASSLSYTWDGILDSGEKYERTYSTSLSLEDTAGNIAHSNGPWITLDITKPTISGGFSDPGRFSPNEDGRFDEADLGGSFSDYVNWTFEIRPEGSTTIVRTLTGSGENFSGSWDGKNAVGTFQEEGRYIGTMTGTDRAGNTQTSNGTSAWIDLTRPTITAFTASNPEFSPNGDTSKDQTVLAWTSSEPLYYPYVKVQDIGGATVYSTGTKLVWGSSWPWDGKTEWGRNPVPEGDYTVTLHAFDNTLDAPWDLAGNPAIVVPSTQVTVDITPPAAFPVNVNNDRISPDGDGAFDTTRLTASGSDWVTWGATAQPVAGIARVWPETIGTTLDITWDGKDALDVVHEGAASVTVTAYDTAGNMRSVMTAIEVDLTPPTLTTSPTLKVDGASCDTACSFSPNSDGVKDVLDIEGGLIGEAWSPIYWSIVASKDGQVFWTGEGTGTAIDTSWDGSMDTGGSAPNGVYELTLEVRDGGDNSGVVEIGTVTMDTLGPAIPFETMNPPYGGNTVLALTSITAKIADAAGISATSVQFKLDGAAIATTWDAGTGWAKTASQAFTDGSTHDVEINATDLLGNTTTLSWTFRKIRLEPKPTTFTLSAMGVDTGQPGWPLGTRTWSFEPTATIDERWLDFRDGSQHPGWGTLASTLPLDDAKVVITDAAGTRDWIARPYEGVSKTVYQQMSYTSTSGAARSTYVASTSVGLPIVSVDLPSTTTAATLVLGSDTEPVQSLASAHGACANPAAFGALDGCSSDPLRVFLGYELASQMGAKVAPPSPPTGNPPAELPVALAFGVMDQQIDPLNPNPYDDGGWNGIWRDIESTLSTTCPQTLETESACEFEGVEYPGGPPLLLSTGTKSYCRASASCYDSAAYQQSGQTQTDNAQRAPKHQCIAIHGGTAASKYPWPGMDRYSVPTDAYGQPTATCSQGWGTALPIVIRSPKDGDGNTLNDWVYHMSGYWESEWGFEDGPTDELGLSFIGTFQRSDGKYTHVPWISAYLYLPPDDPAIYTSHVSPYDGVYPQDPSGFPLTSAPTHALNAWHCVPDPRRLRNESAYLYAAEGGLPPYGIGTGLSSSETGEYEKHGWDQYYRIQPPKPCRDYNATWDGYVFVRHRIAGIHGYLAQVVPPGYSFTKARSDGRVRVTYGHVIREHSYSWKAGAKCVVSSSWQSFGKCALSWLFAPEDKEKEVRVHSPEVANAFNYRSNY